MGSFMPYKNVETLLLAMRSLPDYRLHLLSKMPPQRLVQLTDERLIGENVEVHNGVSDEEYQQLLRQAHALVDCLPRGGLRPARGRGSGCRLPRGD